MTGYGATKRIILEAAAASGAGYVRESNDDSYLLDLQRRIFIVADGLGGHAAGEVASHMAVEKIADELATMHHGKSGQPQEVLIEGICSAHRSIRTVSDTFSGQAGMGTTAVVAWFPTDGESLWLAHIGDSRAYLLREAQLTRLTEDHTLLNQILKAGKIAQDLDSLPPKHLLSQALGKGDYISPDIQQQEVQPGDLYLLCTDGLTDMLDDRDIQRLLHSPENLDSLSQHLVEEANKQGGKDNCTVLLIRVISLAQSCD